MFIETLTAYLAAQYTAWATAHVFTADGDGPDIPELDDGTVDEDVDTFLDNIRANAFEIIGTILVVLALILIVKSATGEKKMWGRVAMCIIGAFACFMPNEFFGIIFGAVDRMSK